MMTSVTLIMVDASTTVQTLLVAMSVSAMKGLNCQAITTLAKVSDISVLL